MACGPVSSYKSVGERMVTCAKELRSFFNTISYTTKKKTKLLIESDGTSGDGITHWHSIKVGNKMVACLTDVKGQDVELTIADKKGNLRKPIQVIEFQNLTEAVKHIYNNL